MTFNKIPGNAAVFIDANIFILPLERHLMPLAASLSQLHGLLTNDAITVATMQDEAIVHLASHDADFDRVPGITRYAPV